MSGTARITRHRPGGKAASATGSKRACRRMKRKHIHMTMFMAVLTVEFSLHGNDNLKAKRRVANSLKQKTRNKFNVAIAEAGTENSRSRLRLAVVSISNSEGHLRSRMDKCALMMEAVCPEEMVDSQVEIYAAD